MFAETASSGNTIIDTLEVFKQPFIIQEYIETGKTKAEDLRVIVAGNKVIGAMKRKSSGSSELRANIHMGGIGEPVTLSYEQEQIAIKAGQALGVDLCAVDILDSGRESYVLEVNLSPGLRGITAATKKNVAGEIAKFLHERTSEYMKHRTNSDVKDMINALDEGKKEIITNIQIKAERLILPEIITKVSGLKPDQEVSIFADSGHVIIKATGSTKIKE